MQAVFDTRCSSACMVPFLELHSWSPILRQLYQKFNSPSSLLEVSSACVMFSWDSLILPLLEVSSACILFSWNSLICTYPLLEVSSAYIYGVFMAQFNLPLSFSRS